MTSTALLGQFLNQLNGFINARNSISLCDWLVLEPPFNEQYQRMIREVQSVFPKGSEDALEQRCTTSLKAAVEGDDGAPWTAFIKFTVQYLSYLRDVSADVSKYLETYELLSELQQRANSALSHATLGHLILPTVVANARLVCRLAIGLDKQPELIAHLRRSGGGAAGGEEGSRETLPERAANILRQAFVTCLNDRVSGLSADGKPEGKKKGIYTIANLCLKILFQCGKTRNATQIFENIYNLSPPLSAYPKSQRVTYLYYLGRFLFQNSHFYRAQHALQYAYDEAPARQECVRQRRAILVYLVAANLILGRFPSQDLLSRPEAQGLGDKFLPICFAIRSGNLTAFRRHLDYDGEHADWFLHFRILLQLRNRCEVLVWRSLARKLFIMVGHRPTDPQGRSAATLNIDYMLAAIAYQSRQQQQTPYTDPDFANVDYGDTTPDATALAIESKLMSLIDQGLLQGFVSHKLSKFAITGSKAKGGNALLAGFPNVWEALKSKTERAGTDDVPGWKKDGSGGAGIGPGMVFNFGAMRPVGAFG
jgi:nuclear mRNA export protein PCID2/THP1